MRTEPLLQIVFDPYGIGDSGDLRVEDSDSYWAARAALRDAIRGRKRLTVVVSNASMGSFFDDLAEEEVVGMHRLDPRTRLLEALAVRKLPQQLEEDPRAVIELGLLKLAGEEPRTVHEDAEDWLLRVELGPVWSRERIDSEQDIATVVLDCIRTRASVAHPLLLSLRKQRLQSWAGSSSGFKPFLTWLAENPSERARAFAVGQLLRPYPWHEASQWLAEDNLVIEIDALPGARGWLERIDLRLAGSAADGLLPPGMALRISRFLGRVLREDGFLPAVRSIGGALSCELHLIRQAVTDRVHNGASLTSEEIDEINRRFANRPDAEPLVSLANEVTPRSVPQPIDSSTPWPTVSTWLRDEYLPFYSRASLLGQLDGTTSCVDAFEKWVVANYSELSRRDDCLAHTVARAVADAAGRGPVLVVLVDGLGAQWASIMEECLARHRLYVEQPSQVRLCIAPTLTGYSKAAMLRGQLPGQFEQEGVGIEGYRQLVMQSLGLSTSEVRVLSDREGSLEMLAEAPTRVCVYLANRFDEDLVHKALSPITRREKVTAHLKQLGQSIADAAAAIEARLGQPVTIVVTGDHGATELSSGDGRIPVSEEVPVTHGRAVLGDLDAVPEGSLALDKDAFLLKDRVIVAAGYRYFGQKPLGLAHGGITPQEMAVPMIVALTTPLAPLRPLVVTVSGTVSRGRSDNAMGVCVLNPNTVAVRLSRLSLRLIRLTTELPVNIEPRGQGTLSGLLDASELRTDTVQISGVAEWSAGGQQVSTEISQTVRTTGAALSDEQFEQMFEEK